MALMELERDRVLVIDGIDGVGNNGRGSRERETRLLLTRSSGRGFVIDGIDRVGNYGRGS